MITDEMLTSYALPVILVVLMGYMFFIVLRLAVDSKAGKFGFFVLLLGLMIGVFGFLLKFIIQWFFESNL